MPAEQIPAEEIDKLVDRFYAKVRLDPEIAPVKTTTSFPPYQKDHEQLPSRIMLTTESWPSKAFALWQISHDNPYVLGGCSVKQALLTRRIIVGKT